MSDASQERCMTNKTMARIDTAYKEFKEEVFREWLLQELAKDINDYDRDSLRLEIIRYCVEMNMI